MQLNKKSTAQGAFIALLVLVLIFLVYSWIPNRNSYLQTLTFPANMSSDFYSGTGGAPSWMCVIAIDSPCGSPAVKLFFERSLTKEEVVSEITNIFKTQNLAYVEQNPENLQEFDSDDLNSTPKTYGLRTKTFYKVPKLVRGGCKYIVLSIDERLVSDKKTEIVNTFTQSTDRSAARIDCAKDTY